jgi:transposase
LIGLTVPELARLLHLAEARPERQAVGLRWSVWRRRHQATARGCHIARRARAQPPPATQPAPIRRLPGVPPLDEALSDRLLAVLPPPATGGRPRVHPLQILGGLVWLMRCGRSWREIPPAFAPWATIASRYRLWQQDGTWNRIAAVLVPATTEGRLFHVPYLSL